MKRLALALVVLFASCDQQSASVTQAPAPAPSGALVPPPPPPPPAVESTPAPEPVTETPAPEPNVAAEDDPKDPEIQLEAGGPEKTIKVGEAYENEHVRITPSQPVIEDDAWRPAPNAPPIPGHGRALRMLITVENKSNEPLPYQMTVHLKDPSGKLVAKRPPNVRERPLEIKPGASETFEHLFAITEKVPGEFSAEISAPAYRTVRRFEFRFSL